MRPRYDAPHPIVAPGRTAARGRTTSHDKLAHLQDAIAAVDVTLDDAEVERLEQPYVPHAVAGFR